MTDEWRSTLLHLGSSLSVIIVLLAVIRVRRLPLQSFLGLRWPDRLTIAKWVALFALLVVVEEFAARALGLAQAEPWNGRYTGLVLALRVVGIVLLAPAAEELAVVRLTESRP